MTPLFSLSDLQWHRRVILKFDIFCGTEKCLLLLVSNKNAYLNNHQKIRMTFFL